MEMGTWKKPGLINKSLIEIGVITHKECGIWKKNWNYYKDNGLKNAFHGLH